MDGKIIATDISAEAIQGARKNAQTAGVERWIEFGICPYEATPIPRGGGCGGGQSGIRGTDG